MTPKKQAPVKPTGVLRKATEDPNYVNLMKKLGKMRKGGVKGKKAKTATAKKGEAKKMKEMPAFMMKGKAAMMYGGAKKAMPAMRKGGMKGKKAC
jgi:hypothetical protein